MPTASKIAISLPAVVLQQLDDAARECHENRSGFIRLAVLSYLEARRREARVRQYVEGYANTPETAEEVALAHASALPLLAGEAWE
jgi:metal-responsive CopG/Arc/MetJ family transcriptional regulator